jgi:hypothetical protein
MMQENRNGNSLSYAGIIIPILWVGEKEIGNGIAQSASSSILNESEN